MISIYLCDDEPLWLKRLEKAIVNYQIKSDWEIKIACSADSPCKLLRHIKENPPANGIYFLDIQYKTHFGGLQLAQDIRRIDSNAHIIFVTIHDELVMETFRLKLSVLDYIVKDAPYPEVQIHQCMRHIEENYLIVNKNTAFTFSFRAGCVYHTILLQNIYYIESVKHTHKVCLHSHSEIYYFSAVLSSLLKKLGSDFFQCHKGCVVNLRHTQRLDSKNHMIFLDNGSSCSCSFREWKNLTERLRTFYL